MPPSPLPGFGTEAAGGDAVPMPDLWGPEGSEEDAGAAGLVKLPVLHLRSTFSGRRVITHGIDLPVK